MTYIVNIDNTAYPMNCCNINKNTRSTKGFDASKIVKYFVNFNIKCSARSPRSLMSHNRNARWNSLSFIDIFIAHSRMNESDISGIVPLGDFATMRGGDPEEVINDLYEYWRDVLWIIERCKILTILNDARQVILVDNERRKVMHVQSVA